MNGSSDMKALVETGANSTFMHPNTARVAKVELKTCAQLKICCLSTKGLHSQINVYVIIDPKVGKRVAHQGVEITDRR